MRKWFHFFVFGALAGSINVNAEQSAHEHGVAKVMLVSEGDVISLRLESPAMNIVGFEHEPRTKAQHKTLDQAVKKLNKPETLIAFNGGQCRFTAVDLENPFNVKGENSDHHHDHDEKKHAKHKHDHEEQKQEKHKHDHDAHKHEHDDSAAEHREFVVEYQSQCKKIDDLKAINFSLLNEFKGIEKLDVQYILSGKQGAVILNSGASRLSIE